MMLCSGVECPGSGPGLQSATDAVCSCVYRSHMMHMILSKMMSGLSGSTTISHDSRPMDLLTVAHSPLVSCFRSIHHNGCVDSDAVHRLDSLMTAAGPVCFTDQLVHVC